MAKRDRNHGKRNIPVVMRTSQRKRGLIMSGKALTGIERLSIAMYEMQGAHNQLVDDFSQLDQELVVHRAGIEAVVMLVEELLGDQGKNVRERFAELRQERVNWYAMKIHCGKIFESWSRAFALCTEDGRAAAEAAVKSKEAPEPAHGSAEKFGNNGSPIILDEAQNAA